MNKDNFFDSVSTLKGVGPQLSKYLKKRKIEKIKDIILNLPYSETDRSKIVKLNELEVGTVCSIKVKVKKLNFPRIRNLPNKIICEDETGKIDIVYFNSREGYLRKLFPLNEWVIISGKINFFNKKYQITNPDYVTTIENQDYVVKNIPKYNLTKGINEKKYRSISEKIISNIPEINDWLDDQFIKKNKLLNWSQAIKNLHLNEKKDNKSKSYRRIVFDEICANFLSLSENRKRIRKRKKAKVFDNQKVEFLIKKLPFKLTNSQKAVLGEIDQDLLSNKRMFRIIQGDVGSGKTIVSLLSIYNVTQSGYQTALMSPTEILAKQHFELSKKIFGKKTAIVPYVMPGFELAKLCHMVISKNHKVEGLILLNHGIFTFGSSAKQSYDRMIKLVTLAENFLNKQKKLIKYNINNKKINIPQTNLSNKTMLSLIYVKILV